MFNGIWRDLVYAGRSLAKARAFTFVCVVSLGIGMAPVIAIPYWARILQDAASRREHGGTGRTRHDAEWLARGRRDVGPIRTSQTLRDSNTGIALIGWKSGESKIAVDRLQGGDGVVATMFVSANYFRTIGVTLVRGPGFDATGDDPLTAEPVVILGYSYWQNQMGCRSGHHRQDAHAGRRPACRGRRRAGAFFRSHGLSGTTALSSARTVSAAAHRHEPSLPTEAESGCPSTAACRPA